MAVLLLLGLGIIDTSPKPAPLVQIQNSPNLPAAPPETFALPKKIEVSEASQWRLLKKRTVQGVATGIYSLSADNRWLAILTQDRQAIRVLDLHTFDAGKTIRLERPADRFSFDPTGKRIIAISDEVSAQLAVIDIQNGYSVILPMPRKRAVPEGNLLWWKEHEVLVGTSENALRILNLETLEVDEASAVPSWKEAKLSERENAIKQMAAGLRETPRWKWEVADFLAATELPEVEGAQGWSLAFGRALAISHPARNLSLSFPQVAFQEGDIFSSSEDGAKVFRFRGNGLDIFYFDLSPAPHLRWTLAMPHEVSGCRDAQKASSALRHSRLSAIVYAPLRNPLNGRVVGPKRDSVKAVLTFESWDWLKAECYASQLFAAIEPNDVVADLCILEGPSSELLSLNAPHRWWARLPEPQPGSADANLLPTRESVAAKMAIAEKVVARPSASEPLPQMPILASPTPTFALPQKSAEDRVREFVTIHHEIAKSGDVDRLLRDYAELVDHFKNGMVDREFIRRDELKYHSENLVLEERILGGIRVARSDQAAGHVAIYALRVSIQDLATRQAKTFVFDVTVEVVETPDGLKIIRQKATKQP